jgi:hypothetical protein
MIYQIIKHSHSGLRWIVILLLLTAIMSSFFKMLIKSNYKKFDKVLSIASLSSVHLQIILGIILYFISPKVIFKAESMSNSMLRFFLVEHVILMLLSATVISIGFRITKKTSLPYDKHLNTFLFYTASLLLIVFSIPWPWKHLGGSWF